MNTSGGLVTVTFVLEGHRLVGSVRYSEESNAAI